MLILNKLLDRELCFGLRLSEFRCKCNEKSCRSVLVNPKLLRAYEKFRRAVGKPLKINSGFRCFVHNMREHGAILSRHTAGDAIDISYTNFKDLFTPEEVIKMLKEAGFTYILHYIEEDFFHADVRELN